MGVSVAYTAYNLFLVRIKKIFIRLLAIDGKGEELAELNNIDEPELTKKEKKPTRSQPSNV